MEEVFAKIREEFSREACPAEVLAMLEHDSQGRLSVAFSGGPDSLFLLLWLKAWFPEHARSTDVLHFNHRTRPEENAAEVQLAADWARRLEMPFRSGEREERGGGSEEELRKARFTFLEAEMERSGSRVLLLGHNADDVAETLLARLARGSGPEGLAAPRPVSFHAGGWQHGRARPLLHFSAAAIRQFLRQWQLVSTKDPSNESESYLRNRIRSRVLPAWKEAVDRDLLDGMARSRSLMAESVDFVESAARAMVPGGWSQQRLEIGVLRKSHPAPVRFLLQRWLGEADETVSPDLIDILVRAVFESVSGRWTVGTNRWVVLEGNALFLSGDVDMFFWNPVRWREGVSLYLPDGSILRRESIGRKPDLCEKILQGESAGPDQVYLRREAEGPLDFEVRLWHPGDRFRPLGAPGTRKLQDWFTDRKIPAVLRRRLPVVVAGEEIVWVPGFPPADSMRIRSVEENLLSLTYEPS